MGDNNNEDICMICLEIKTNPKTLRCKHSFCHGCITQLTMHSRFYLHGPKCPLCRSTLEDKPQQSAAGGSNRHSGLLTNLREVNARVRNSEICVERAIRELRRVWYDLSSDSDEDDINTKMPRCRSVDVTTHATSHGRSCSTAQLQNIQQEREIDSSINNDSTSANQLEDLNNLVENVHIGDDAIKTTGNVTETSDELLKQIVQGITAQGTSHRGSLSTPQLNNDEQQSEIGMSFNSGNHIIDGTIDSTAYTIRGSDVAHDFQSIDNENFHLNNDTLNSVEPEVEFITDVSANEELDEVQVVNANGELDEVQVVNANAVLEVEFITDVNADGELDEVQVVNANGELDEVQVVNAYEELNETSSTNNEEKI
ncbi:uncharacterized protein LOC119673490 [Teleopsis dalmanni]|uniref:uncharacterized protein LOC119672262 n=1 Tax=Teleopsis dalmanni TaxID=139649 RepID=UPI000D32B0E6|nr:uncharacterized protein LOC119672262 [Teleopsis dalmanni]XP_037939201.1 uncharacterized protein LOC119672262 [Teleopsis dalmanni]XP_037939202.1 uncharacterized protein LOC119672262 [Teleopsis dalmanni]XP_037940708.1 uncharacterized protein LOC119673490 [Teleopsis dalmanni]